MLVFRDFTVLAVTGNVVLCRIWFATLQHEAIWHLLNKRQPRTTHSSSCSQFNSSNYMPLEFGLHSRGTVCAFRSNTGWRRCFWGQRKCRKCRQVLAARRIQCGLPLSPLMQGSFFPCLAVLFSPGDLEVSNSAIQIHCVHHILSSPPILLYLLPSSPSPASSRSIFPQFYSTSLLLSLLLSFHNLISAYFLSSPV